MAADLQSAPFGRSGTCPYVVCDLHPLNLAAGILQRHKYRLAKNKLRLTDVNKYSWLVHEMQYLFYIEPEQPKTAHPSFSSQQLK
jgi:hypothetical protein